MTTTSPLRYFIVDAFTDRPFAGNPAAVVPMKQWREDSWLQNVAMEMNLSETAFFVPTEGGFHLRWMTPKVEVDLCGHATLATAKVIGHLGLVKNGETIRFESRSGTLTARLGVDHIELDFPLKKEEATAAPAGLLEALGTETKYVGKNTFDFLVEVEGESVVRKLTPDCKRLASVGCRGVIVTARSDDPKFDFVSRFFAPGAGIDEDPVTGSAHCCLAGFWSKRLGKTKFMAYQASARGGVINVELVGDRVLLGGQAVIVAHGKLCL